MNDKPGNYCFFTFFSIIILVVKNNCSNFAIKITKQDEETT